MKIAQEFNVAVLLTNQVTADPGNMWVGRSFPDQGSRLMTTLCCFRTPGHHTAYRSPCPAALIAHHLRFFLFSTSRRFVADAKKPVGGNMLAHYVHSE